MYLQEKETITGKAATRKLLGGEQTHPGQQAWEKYREQSWRHDLAHPYQASLFLRFVTGKAVAGAAVAQTVDAGLPVLCRARQLSSQAGVVFRARPTKMGSPVLPLMVKSSWFFRVSQI